MYIFTSKRIHFKNKQYMKSNKLQMIDTCFDLKFSFVLILEKNVLQFLIN